MNEELIIEGTWKIGGEDQPAHYGRLICHPKEGLRLEVKEVRTLDFESLMTEGKSHRWLPSAQTIQGWSADNSPVRLFGCVPESSIRKSGIQTHQFYVQRAVTNLSGGSWPETRSRNFQLRFSILQSWMDRRISVREDDARPADIRMAIRPGLTVTLGAIIHSSTSRSRFEVSHDSWVGLEYAEDQSVCQVRSKDTMALALLLTLLIGSPVALDDFKFLETGASTFEMHTTEHRLLEPRGYFPDANDKKDSWFMRAPFPKVQDILPEMLRRAFELMDNPDMRAVFDLYAAVMFSELYDTARFLMLAQALEAFHTACGRFIGTAMPPVEFAALRKRVSSALTEEDFALLRERFIFANNKTYRMKIEELLATAPDQAKMVISDAEKFSNVMKNLRNAYTHHVGSTSQRTRQEHDRKVPQLAHQALALLEMLLLSEMGAPGCAFDRIASEHRTAVYVDLSDSEIPPNLH